MASNDSHYGVAGVWGLGLMAVVAPELTREALWEAFMARRVYGVTGDRIQLGFAVNDSPMGSVLRTEEAPRIRVNVVASQALDRIEILRNNRVVYTHCHSGTWDVPVGEGPVRAKVKVECGWGPTPQYNFAAPPKHWNGELLLSGGRILSVEPCFTNWDQKLEPLLARSCRFHLTTGPRELRLNPSSRQALIFEVEAPLRAPMALETDGWQKSTNLSEALEGSQVVGLVEQARAQISERFLLRPEEIENPDTFWHNAYKVKIHTAIPEDGYTAEVEWVDENPDPGTNWYYVRVSELNGQMAWSSPIWVERG